MRQQKLSKQSIKLAQGILSCAESVSNLAKRVDDKRVKELVRRVAISIEPDGFPSGGSSGKTSGGEKSDPTFGAMLAKDKTRKDPIASDLRRLYSDLEKAESHMKSAVARLDGIDRKVEEKVKRTTSTPCAICLQLPATKSGYCNADYLDWWRYGQPDRTRFELWRRGEVNSEGRALVEDCPPPSEGNTASVGPYREKK